MTIHSILCTLTALAFVAGGAIPAYSQLLQGGIDGQISDGTNAAIAGASVTAMNEQTNALRSTTSNATGFYSFPTLQPGSYTIQVQSDGFQSWTKRGVQVSINSITRANAVLAIGQVTEQVTVEASAAILQTDRAEVRAEVNEKALKNLPVPLGRNYQMLYVTLPGFSPPTNAHSIPSNPSRAVQFSVNGTSRSNNNTRIDGASSTNLWLPHMVAYVPALESIETVNVVTNSFDAEQGLAGGAAINVQIKSGTNQVHGSAFEYHTNQHTKAYPWISDRASAKPKFIYNQFGGTVGGPIRKDKVFFFTSYEGTREAESSNKFVSVPTAEMRTGDLSASPTPIFDPMTGNSLGAGRSPFPNNMIPLARHDPAVRTIINDGRWPLPNIQGTGPFGLARNYLGGAPVRFFRDTLDAKVNWNINDKLTSFARFSYLDFRTRNPQIFGDFGGVFMHRTDSNPGRGWGNTYSGTLSATYVVSSTFIVDGYFGYTLMDSNIEQDNLDQNIGLDFLKIPGTNGTRPWEGGWPRLRIDGFEQLGISNDFMPYYRTDPQRQWVVNGNWTKGNHNVRFGTDLYFQTLKHNQPQVGGSGGGGASGGFRFQQGTTQLRGGPAGNDFNSMGSFLLGLSRESGRVVQFPDDGVTTRSGLYSLYLRDRWQLSPKTTVSYGVRWEYFPFPDRLDRGLEGYDLGSNQMLICGIGVVPRDCGIQVSRGGFAPRVGIAHRATDTFVIRAGYGITNDPATWMRPLRGNYPILLGLSLPSPNAFMWSTTLRQGLPSVPQPDLGNGIIPLPANIGTTFADNGNTVRGYVQSWNFTMEKSWGSWITSAGYVATRSVNQLASLNQNWAPIDTGNPGQVLRQKFGRNASTNMLGSLGTAKYDSLQLRGERRFAGGYQIGLSYTWGHARGYASESSPSSPPIAIPWLYGLTYGPLSQDIRHNAQATWVVELPFGRNRKWVNSGLASTLLGGWQMNGLFSAYTGQPFTVSASGAALNAPGSSQRADCLAPAQKIGTVNEWLSSSSFAPVLDPRFGTCGSNSLRGPGLLNLDLGIFRKFQVSERFDIQLRAEAFNVSNTPHFNNPNSNVNSAAFMTITGLKNTGREGIDERVFRLGLRIGF